MTIQTEKGAIEITNEVFTMISGNAATNCFGVKGMAQRNVKDGIVGLLKKENVSKGVEMTLKAFCDTLEKLGVVAIDMPEDKKFDPNLHNAVMHVEDDAYGEGEIVEVLQKGYMRGERVLRYAMVKVAN